ncbi:hypothetical protein ACU4GD_00765 [Cupriavidus basilensis]
MRLESRTCAKAQNAARRVSCKGECTGVPSVKFERPGSVHALRRAMAAGNLLAAASHWVAGEDSADRAGQTSRSCFDRDRYRHRRHRRGGW